jgi:hypothetical protein
MRDLSTGARLWARHTSNISRLETATGPATAPVDEHAAAGEASVMSTRGDEANKRWLTAVHEAAHVVADTRFGFNPTDCDLAQVEGRLGRARTMDGWDDEDGAWNSIVSLLVGYCASIEAGEEEEMARGGAEDDFDQAAEIWPHLGRTVTEKECLEMAFTFVRTPKNWKAIQIVAADLVERRHLDADEIAILIEIADGHSQRADLEDYRRNRG